MVPFQKIKVLETIRQGFIGGGESHVLDLVEHLDKSIFEPIVLSFTDGQMIARLNRMGIKTYVINTEKPFDITKWNQVKQLMRAEAIDIVHAHGTRANTNVFAIAKSLRIPIVYTIHGWSFHDGQNLIVKRFRQKIESYLTKKMDYNISVSRSNQFTGIENFKGFRSMVINNGINLVKFNSEGTFKNIRKEYGIPQNVTLLGFIVRITLQKDPFTMIRAFHKVLQKEQNIRLLMIGEGDLKKDTIKLTKELDISDYVIFDNFRQDIPDVLKAIDIYCLPSLWEGLPIGLLEAMAMEKAIIATKVDGSMEVIKNGENGLLIETKQPESLANAILQLHNEFPLRKKLESNAKMTISEHFDANKMTRKIEEIYYKAIENRVKETV